MQEYYEEAIKIVLAQAKLRVMTPEEVEDYARKVFKILYDLNNGEVVDGEIRPVANYSERYFDQASNKSSPSGSQPYPGEKKQPGAEILNYDPQKAITEDHIQCCVCGKLCKILTKKHLEQHGLTRARYREICKYDPKQPLASIGTSQSRSETTSAHRIWEKSNPQKAKGK